MNYREEYEVTKGYKIGYRDGFEKLIEAREGELEAKRRRYAENIFKDPEPYREDLKKMLGWPLVDQKREGAPSVRCETLAKETGYTIYRLHFKIFDELELTGLYFEHDSDKAKPLVLVQHGGWGTPEVISNFYGLSTTYNDMLERVVERGVNAFAPQLLLWRCERYDVNYNRTSVDARLKRTGGSVSAVELYALMRVLDYFEIEKNVTSFGMVGLSYGGFYTLFLSAIDKRIRSAVSCSFFNRRDKYPWLDWTWFGAAEKFDDAEVACLVYPRRLCIELGINDEVFEFKYGRESYERLLEACRDVGTDWLDLVEFDGVHEFCKDDRPIERMIEDLWLKK